MLFNYLKIALRNLLKNTVYSFINITGLSVGLACSMLIMLWVNHEVSFDKFHPNADRIFQVWINGTYDGTVNSFQTVPFQTKEAIKTEDSRITNTALSAWPTIHLLANGATRVNQTGQIVTDEFLDIFQFPLSVGSRDQALDDPSSIVLTESTARVLFGNDNPLGRMVLLDNKREVKVTGILKDLPENSSFQFKFLLPIKLFEQDNWVQEGIDDWGDYNWLVYVELQSPTAKDQVEASIKDMLARKGQTDVQREFFLHPLLRWHLHSRFENGKEAGGKIDYVQGFTLIAIFILVIACINFMNLATARSERRAREVGIRKSIGSLRSELILQFIGESIMVTSISFVVAVAIVELALPFYNTLVGKNLFIDFTSMSFWIFAVGIIVITGVISGSYPAFYLSSFTPAIVLKGKPQVSRGAIKPRQALVILQFVFATGLIIGTLVIAQQIQHTRNRELGYDQKNLISVWYTEEIQKNYDLIKQDLLASGAVASVTKSNSPITSVHANNFIDWPGKPAEQKVLFANLATGYDYTKTMGIKMLEGRDFSPDFKSDTAAVIINKAAAEMMGFDDILGKQVTYWGERKGTIIGVIDNVLMESPHGQVRPLFIVFQPEWVSAITIRLENTDDIAGSLQQVADVFKTHDPSHPFDYSFVDEQFEKKFTTITMTSRIGNLFAFLAIFITSLGLFGLAAFTAEQRTKEIGIRKVLGASVFSLVSMLIKEFSWLTIIAFLIAAPLSWWGLNKFLEQFAYRTEFPLWVLGMAGGAALIFALAVVSTQAFRAARANPVDSLKNE